MGKKPEKAKDKLTQKEICDFYDKYNIQTRLSTDNIKPNGNYRYIWETIPRKSNEITTSIY